MVFLDNIKLKTDEWLSVHSNIRLLEKVAFVLIIVAYLLPAPVWLSELLFWLAIFIAVFLTYLNYKSK